MNDEQILERGGTDRDVKEYAEQNGANLTREDVEADTLYRVRTKIIEAVPEIVEHCIECEVAQIKSYIGCTCRPITLEDVLRAIESSGVDAQRFWTLESDGEFIGQDAGDGSPVRLGVKWHLGKPLEERSPETIAFLHSLLCA